MKPINLDESGCAPLSSNCVIWQGPDIECIKLCKGDTVSDVVYKLALELCEIMDTLNITNYDLTCLNLGSCEPKDFQELIQLLIDKICECCDVTPTAEQKAAGCPDCVVPIAEVFYYVNPQGDTVKSMQLDVYAQAIGNKVNTIVGEINTIDATLGNHETRLKSLESAPAPTLDLPQITPTCTSPSVPTDLDIVVDNLETQFCELRAATGEPNDIFQGIGKTPAGLNDSPQLAGSGLMSALVGWKTTVTDLSDSFGNMWLAITDIRAAIASIKSALPSLCDDIDIAISASLPTPGSLLIFFTGSIPQGSSECNLAGTSVKIMDTSGNSIIVDVPLNQYLNNQSGFSVNVATSPLNSAEDFTITASYCFTDGNTECQSVGSYVLVNSSLCPTITLNPSVESLDYSFSWTGASALLTINLYDASGTTLLDTTSTSVTVPTPVSGTFTGLTADTGYRVVLEITSGSTTTECPFVSTTTLPEPCTPPSGVSATITIP